MSSKAYHRRIWHEMQHLIAVGGGGTTLVTGRTTGDRYVK